MKKSGKLKAESGNDDVLPSAGERGKRGKKNGNLESGGRKAEIRKAESGNDDVLLAAGG